MMTLKDWLKINHNHRKLVQLNGDRVRVTLYGGNGIDQRLVGDGDDDDDDEATTRALDVRRQMTAVMA